MLTSPWGGQLPDLSVSAELLPELRAYAASLPSIQLSERAICDLEMLAAGGFAPLERFMGRADFEHVVHTMRLADGTLFPIPVTLPAGTDAPLSLDRDVALRSATNELLAVMTVEEIYTWDEATMAQLVFGTRDTRHPLVAELTRWGKHFLSGPLRLIQSPRHLDFHPLRMTPAQSRARLERLGYEHVVAFQTPILCTALTKK